MGDRRNVVFDFGLGTHVWGKVVLYSHNWGRDLVTLVANAMDANRNRWDDPGYLTRFIVTHVVNAAGDSTDEYGWGLYPNRGPLTGDGHEDIVIDLQSKTVTIKKTRTFEEFVQAKKGAV